MWKSFDPTAVDFDGVKTSGDKRVPPTTKWKKLFLIWFFWKRQALFMVEHSDHTKDGYKVGFYDKFGTCMVLDTIMHDRFFRVRVGHEPCIFFALDPSMNTEIPIRLIKHFDAGEEGEYRGSPLL